MGSMDKSAKPARRIAGFDRLIGKVRLERLEKHVGAVYGIWPDCRLGYFNPAWRQFAEENGGEPAISRDWGLGRSVMDAVPEELKQFYEEFFVQCLDADPVMGHPPYHEYECSSEKVYRKFVMNCSPLANGAGLLVINSILVERPHDKKERVTRLADKSVYIDGNGLVGQCIHCRRVLNRQIKNRWDWVPEWVAAAPSNISHTLCETCFSMHYPHKIP